MKIPCLVCQEIKERIVKVIISLEGKKSKVFIEPSTGRVWSKQDCPDCVEFLKEEERKETQDPRTRPNRVCNLCSGPITEDRYYVCKKCRPTLVNVMDEFIYQSEGLDDQTIEQLDGLEMEPLEEYLKKNG